jgi:hypothetical protein
MVQSIAITDSDYASTISIPPAKRADQVIWSSCIHHSFLWLDEGVLLPASYVVKSKSKSKGDIVF